MRQNTESGDASSQSGTDSLDVTSISVTYKVLGDLADPNDAIGVLGRNTAGSGTTKGIEGRVDSPDGYGLYTPDDAKIDGTTELATLGGSLTDDTPMGSVTGEGLAIDDNGVLNSHIYRTFEFTSAGTTWSAISVSNESRVEVTVDMNDVTYGRVGVDIDGSRTAKVEPNEVYHRILSPSSSVSVTSLNWWAFDDSFSVSSQLGDPTGVAFKPDGTRMYVIGADTDSVYSYTLSTAWDVSTASFQNEFDVSTEDGWPTDLAFKSDGSKLFVPGINNTKVYTYGLSTAWDITTASLSSSFDVSSATSDPRGLTFGDTGSKMFVCSRRGANLYAYNLSTSWDVSTASFAAEARLFDPMKVPSGPSGADGVAFNSDGSKAFIVDSFHELLYVYSLSTAWDITTTSGRSTARISSPSEDEGPIGVTLKTDDTELYVSDTIRLTVDAFGLVYSGTAYSSVRKE